MKNLIFAIGSSLMITLQVFSQANVYHPFPQCYAAWGNLIGTVAPSTYYYNYYLSGDTLISGQTYSKVFSADSVSNSYYAAIREDNSKHIYIYKGSEEQLLYDFNMAVAIPMQPTYIFPDGAATVLSEDSILIGSSYRKEYNVFDPNLGGEIIIEGIGGSCGLFQPPATLLGMWWFLTCFTQNGVTLYSPNTCKIFRIDTTRCYPKVDSSDSVKSVPVGFMLYPNPATSQVTLQIGLQQNQVGAIMNLNDAIGRLISTTQLESTSNTITQNISELPSGVYYYTILVNKKVINERKLVVVQPKR